MSERLLKSHFFAQTWVCSEKNLLITFRRAKKKRDVSVTAFLVPQIRAFGSGKKRTKPLEAVCILSRPQKPNFVTAFSKIASFRLFSMFEPRGARKLSQTPVFVVFRGLRVFCHDALWAFFLLCPLFSSFPSSPAFFCSCWFAFLCLARFCSVLLTDLPVAAFSTFSRERERQRERERERKRRREKDTEREEEEDKAIDEEEEAGAGAECFLFFVLFSSIFYVQFLHVVFLLFLPCQVSSFYFYCFLFSLFYIFSSWFCSSFFSSSSTSSIHRIFLPLIFHVFSSVSSASSVSSPASYADY